MRAGTHVVFAFLLGLLVLFIVMPGLPIVIFFGVLVFASLLPDIDYAKSTIGRHFKLVGLFVGHRGIFHSVFALVAVGILSYLIRPVLVFPALLGYGSHLFLDALNSAGITPFHPFGKKVRGPVRNGSLGEFALFVVFLALTLALVWYWFG